MLIAGGFLARTTPTTAKRSPRRWSGRIANLIRLARYT